jgi:hypothetical protein
MDFQTEKYISNFISNQFPRFYEEEGPNFILFTKAYYEWMEESGNPIKESRSLFDYRDIDNTIDEFLEYFQRKYLYGIPFKTISQPKFLLKHILDVYRSKGTIQCYRLLFKLLYDKDIDVYLPGDDVLRPSDGTWIEPRYLELTDNNNLQSLVGNSIKGISSGTTAVVENYVKETYYRDIINTLYISNILPRGGNFIPGEKIVLLSDVGNTAAVSSAPTVLGSLDSLTIINGGQNFNIGDIIKIAHNDLTDGSLASYGADGLLKVTELSKGFGSLSFNILAGGFGYIANAQQFIYRNDSTGTGALFNVGSVSNTQTIEYNTDIICDYANLTLNSATFGFTANASANLSSNVGIAMSYTNNIFGTISSLTNVKTGNGYTQPANVFVRSCQFSKVLPGNVSYTTTSNTITGTNTIFGAIFANDDVIYIQGNSSLSTTIELAVIKTVTSNTSIVLYGPPSKNSTPSAKYRAAPVILPSNFAVYESFMYRADGKITGINENIQAIPSSGNNIVSKAIALNSGKGYVEGEQIKAYLYSGISNNISILAGGVNYTNGDLLVFAGGGAGTSANAYVTTNGNGAVTNVTLTYVGSGYTEIPRIGIQTKTGFEAIITVSLVEYNTTSEIIGRVVKTGVGKGRGFWTTTRSFLNSDKYIQDSYYYQDYSYEIKVSETLDKYKNVLYNTFHSAGSEMFGKYLSINKQASETSILDESTQASIS